MFLADVALGKGLDGVAARLKGFAGTVASIGARLGKLGGHLDAPLIAAARQFADAGDELAKAARRTGVGVDSLSELAFAAEQSGSDLEGLEGSLKKMQKFLGQAALGSDEARASLLALGLPIQAIIRLGPEAQLNLFAEAISRIRNPALQASAAMTVFGKSGTSLLPLLQGGARGIQEFQRQARELGYTLSPEDAAKAEALKEAFNILRRSIAAITKAIGSTLVPDLIEAIAAFARIARQVKDWAKANPDLFRTILKIGAVLVGAGTALTVFGGALAGIGALAGALFTGIGLLLSPVGLLTAAVVGLTYSFGDLRGVVGSAVTWVVGKVKGLAADVVASLGGIVSALKAGEFRLAAQILWQTLKVEWLKGVKALDEAWVGLKLEAYKAWDVIKYGLLGAFVDAWAGIKKGWAALVDFVKGKWDSLVAGIGKGLIDAVADATVAIAKAKAGLLGGDPTEEIRGIRRDASAAKGLIDADVRAKAEGREVARTGEAYVTDLDRQDEKDRLERQRRENAAARARAQRAGIDTTELDAEKDKLQKLLDKAKAKDKGLNLFATRSGNQEFDTETLDAGIKTVEQKTEAKGTFSAFGVRGLGLGDTMSEILKEEKKTNMELEKLNNKADEGALVFGS